MSDETTPEETGKKVATTEPAPNVLSIPLDEVAHGFIAVRLRNGDVQIVTVPAKPDLNDLAMLAYTAERSFQRNLQAAETIRMLHADMARAAKLQEEESIRAKIMKGR